MPRMPVEVGRAGVVDVPTILELWSEGRDELGRGVMPVPAPGLVRARLEAGLAAGQVEVLLARWDGRAVGFVLLREAEPPFFSDARALMVEHLFVRRDARRHGVARALLNGVVAQAERGGVEQVVTSVTPWARETQRFFARLGFAPVSVRRSVAPSVLRRRLTGEVRSPLDEMLSRRRSLRARTTRRGQVPLDDVLDRPGADPAPEADPGPRTGGFPRPA